MEQDPDPVADKAAGRGRAAAKVRAGALSRRAPAGHVFVPSAEKPFPINAASPVIRFNAPGAVRP